MRPAQTAVDRVIHSPVRLHHRLNAGITGQPIARAVIRTRILNEVLQFLLDHGVACKRGVSNAHQEPAYAGGTHWRAAPDGLAVSERLRDQTVLLPLYHAMDDTEMEAVLAALAALDGALGGRRAG